jgi:hypothetical protein
LLLVKLWMLV